jgi:hypothetical protein
MSGMRAGTAHAHFLVGRYDEAASWAAMALQDNADFQAGLRIDAASNAMAGRPEQAHKAVARLRQLISKTCWALIGVPKTSRVTKKDCGKPGCPNDHHSLVLAGAGEMIEQERRLPPLARLRHANQLTHANQRENCPLIWKSGRARRGSQLRQTGRQ